MNDTLTHLSQPHIETQETDTSVFTAARYLCERSGWRISPQEVHKLLYLAQMLSLGDTGRPIFKEEFEARRNGPVCPELQKKLKWYGKGRIINIERR